MSQHLSSAGAASNRRKIILFNKKKALPRSSKKDEVQAKAKRLREAITPGELTLEISGEKLLPRREGGAVWRKGYRTPKLHWENRRFNVRDFE